MKTDLLHVAVRIRLADRAHNALTVPAKTVKKELNAIARAENWPTETELANLRIIARQIPAKVLLRCVHRIQESPQDTLADVQATAAAQDLNVPYLATLSDKFA